MVKDFDLMMPIPLLNQLIPIDHFDFSNSNQMTDCRRQDDDDDDDVDHQHQENYTIHLEMYASCEKAT